MTDNITLTHFEEQKRIGNSEFQDIEDQIVGFYLITKPNTPSIKRIRKKIQEQLIPLYKIVKTLSRDVNVRKKCPNAK